jgi:POT family proton-dependent oligopeptide transporter
VSVLQEWIDAGDQPSIAWQFFAYAILTASEVMVSITCLEFAYTQAPKRMKSVVMAVFLFSVSAGNVFTAVVNRYIQTPSVMEMAAGLTPAEFEPGLEISDANFPAIVGQDSSLIVLGPDGQAGTADDVVVTFNKEGGIDSATNPSEAAFKDAAKKIEDAFFAIQVDQDRVLPDDRAGAELLGDATDSFGNPIRYKTLSRDSFLLLSMGADKTDGTQWDQTLTSVVSRAETAAQVQDPNYFSWLERRKMEVDGDGDPAKTEEVKERLRNARGGGTETTISGNYAVGGRVLLEGAAYFWFWTKCITATAILFIPVGYFYREKTYIQGDEDIEDFTMEAEAEATS